MLWFTVLRRSKEVAEEPQSTLPVDTEDSSKDNPSAYEAENEENIEDEEGNEHEDQVNSSGDSLSFYCYFMQCFYKV